MIDVLRSLFYNYHIIVIYIIIFRLNNSLLLNELNMIKFKKHIHTFMKHIVNNNLIQCDLIYQGEVHNSK